MSEPELNDIWAAEVVRLRDERDRLREALELCVERLEGLSEDGLTKCEQQALDTAKAALTPAGGGGGEGRNETI